VPRLILLLAVGLVIYLVYRHISGLPQAQRRAAWLKVGLAGLAVVVIVLTLTGRMNWVGAAITALFIGASRVLPALIRLFPVLQWLKGRQGSAANSHNSQVETALLRMVLDHSTGELRGEVLDGEHRGRQLDELDRAQLDALLESFRSRDADSARLLESYMQKRFGDSWEGGHTPPPQQDSRMGRAEALAVLGLDEGADEAAIVAAHRHLMQRLHPDRGGTDYLAAKLNQAKDTLLG